MKIRLATQKDIDAVFEVYERARGFMRDNGNPTQWGSTYPPESLVRSDIAGNHLYLLESDLGDIEGVFALFEKGDPDYNEIDGAWLNNEPYAAVHRIASAGKSKGIFTHILDFCMQRSRNLKIDTHKQNTVMQHVLKKHGFKECGIITADGLPFIAFQLCK